MSENIYRRVFYWNYSGFKGVDQPHSQVINLIRWVIDWLLRRRLVHWTRNDIWPVNRTLMAYMYPESPRLLHVMPYPLGPLLDDRRALEVHTVVVHKRMRTVYSLLAQVRAGTQAERTRAGARCGARRGGTRAGAGPRARAGPALRAARAPTSC
jgi:hypothetical protein